MKTVQTSVCTDYSYLINNQLTDVPCTAPTTIEFQVVTAGDFLLEMTPFTVDSAKWNTILPFNLRINNNSPKIVNTLKIKINTPSSLPLVVSSLRNVNTKVVYDIKDSQNDFTITEPINGNSSMTLRFSTSLLYEPDIDGYIATPLSSDASSSTLNNHSNLSTINISESDLSLNVHNEGRQLVFENKGTISSASFSYKYLAPTNTTSISFTGSQSDKASYSKLGNYYILKVPSLPKSILEAKEILYADFTTA